MQQWQIFLIFGLFMLVLSSFDSAEAAASPISISSDSDSGDILEGEFLVFTLTLDSNDTRYRNMEVYMVAHWPSGIAWSYYLVDYNYDELDSNLIRMGAGEQATINIMIICEGLCSAGDTNELRIYGLTDPRFYLTDYGEGEDPGNHTDTCGSADCKNDTTPASASSNITNGITFELTSYLNYSHSVVIDGFLMSGIACNGTATGDHLVYDSSSFITWNFTLNNTGYLDDFYTINWTLYYVEESEEVLVDLLSLNSLQSYPLVSGASTPGNNSFSDKINFSITNASLGNYTIFLVFNSGSIDNPATCIMDFQIVEAELIGWEGTGYNCSFTNTTFCDETREYCAEGVTNEDGATCASMIDTYCDGYGKDDSGCESWSSSKDINDCYAVTGREADDPFTKGYCDEFFAGQESISEDLSITLSRNMIIGLVITVLAIVSIYMLYRKETKI